MKQLVAKYPAIPFVLPFVVFIVILGLKGVLPVGAKWEYPIQVLFVSAALLLASSQAVVPRPRRPGASICVGLLVFAVWVGPDLIWPSYRHRWLFENPLTGAVQSSLTPALRSDRIFLIFRVFGSVGVVPIIEELFWRGWLMRYLVNSDFLKVPFGTYTVMSFWATAVLFAAEHGPLWDVGLLGGLIYNWWALRSGNLADCVIAHAVTNGCLALFVIVGGRWEYWL